MDDSEHRPASVLLVDDDPFLAQMVRDVLSAEGYSVSTTPTGLGAIEYDKVGLDLVVLDIMLPDMSGYEVCRALKSDPRSHHIPIIMLTARADSSDKIGGLKAGADDYITKPFDVDEFIARVEAMLRIKRGEDALRERNQEMATLLEANRLLSSSLELSSVVGNALQMVRRAVPAASAGTIVLYSESEHALVAKAIWNADTIPGLKFNAAPGEGAIGRAFSQRQMVIESIPGKTAAGSVVETSGEGTMVGECADVRLILWCIPISHQSEPIGVIALVGTPDALAVHRHSALIEAIASQAGLAIQNASLYDHVRGMFQSSIQLLAAAIDAKDPSTHSHSRDVSRYAKGIAEAMGLPRSEVEAIERAALIHDIGKIGVVDSILGKPGPLEPPEQAVMMAHPRIGASILEQMPDLAELVPMVKHHHERYDGRGYPDGLQGQQIPLGARILAVADAFEAMTSNRPYRQRQGLSKAVEALLAGRGTQFDPSVVDAFIHTLDGQLAEPSTRIGAPSLGEDSAHSTGEFHVREVALIYEIFRDAHVILDLPALLTRIRSVLEDQIPGCRFAIELVDAGPGQGPRALHLPPAAPEEGSQPFPPNGAAERLYPLSLNGQVRAVLHAWPRGTSRIREDDSRLLRDIAPQLALIIDAGLLHHRTRQDAARDRLTGLYTRRYLHHRLGEETARARRKGNLLTLCLIDVQEAVDGQAKASSKASDELMRAAAAALRDSTRASDLVARYGDGELALVATETDAGGLNQALRRFEGLLADRLRLQAERRGLEVSISIAYGVAVLPNDGSQPEELLERAEQRLISARRRRASGRQQGTL